MSDRKGPELPNMPGLPLRYRKPAPGRRIPGKDRQGPKISHPDWPERPAECVEGCPAPSKPPASADTQQEPLL